MFINALLWYFFCGIGSAFTVYSWLNLRIVDTTWFNQIFFRWWQRRQWKKLSFLFIFDQNAIFMLFLYQTTTMQLKFRIMRTLKNLKYFNGWNIKHLCSLNAWLNIWIVDQNLILSNYSFDDDTDDTVFISKKTDHAQYSSISNFTCTLLVSSLSFYCFNISIKYFWF